MQSSSSLRLKDVGLKTPLKGVYVVPAIRHVLKVEKLGSVLMSSW